MINETVLCMPRGSPLLILHYLPPSRRIHDPYVHEVKPVMLIFSEVDSYPFMLFEVNPISVLCSSREILGAQ